MAVNNSYWARLFEKLQHIIAAFSGAAPVINDDYKDVYSSFWKALFEKLDIVIVTIASGSGGTVDQTARDMAGAAQNTADGKEPSLGNFAPEVPPRRRYLSAIFDQYNSPSYRATSWETLPDFMQNAAQATPTSAVSDNFNAWVAYQRPSADVDGLKIGKFETQATTNKPAVFDGYTKFFTLLFHVSSTAAGGTCISAAAGGYFPEATASLAPGRL
jgi:hypothetical protein